MAQSFRLYGPAIGKSTAVVDADVTGVSLDGSIELTPQDGNLPTFQLDSPRLRKLADENKAYDLDTVDTNAPIWKAIEDVEKRFEKATDDRDAFVNAAETLFRGAR